MDTFETTPDERGRSNPAARRDDDGSVLSVVELFRELDPRDLAEIERACSQKRYAPQEQIIDRDGGTSEVYFVISGRVRIVNYSVSGREITFDELTAGSSFGEIAALDGQPRSANVLAVEETLIAALSRRVFIETLSRHPSVALAVMRRLARIVRAADERIMDLSTLAAQNRVQADLLRQARGHMVASNTARIAPIPLHSDIASRVSTTRETVARVMNDLARKGLVKRTKTALVIRDVALLESLVEDVRG